MEIKFLDNLAKSFEKLPGVGKKTAQRYAYYVVEKLSLEETEQFAKRLVETKNKIKYCNICGMLTDKDTCEICSSSYREKKQIMVVKDTKDVFAIEKTSQYNGLYHVLNGLISPLDGVSPDDLNIESTLSTIFCNIFIIAKYGKQGKHLTLVTDQQNIEHF